jgi:predicted kinase
VIAHRSTFDHVDRAAAGARWRAGCRLVLVVMTGLPATGKSTVAHAIAASLSAAYLPVDPIFGVIAELPGVDDPLGKGAYAVVRRLAELQLSLGTTTVIDAVNPFESIRSDYEALAERYETECRVVYLAFSSIDAHRARVEHRAAERGSIAWPEVEAQTAYYEPPLTFAVKIDAESSREAAIDQALQAVRS